MAQEKKYLGIVAHYESCLTKHGDNHLGVDWPRPEDVETRHRVMLEVIRPESPGRRVRLLDFGCGASHLYEYLVAHGRDDIEYAGLDLSEKFIQLSRAKFPLNQYFCLDVLDDVSSLPRFDYVVMNGVFTEKRDLSFHEMFSYFRQALTKIFSLTDVGVAFNVISKEVDWERQDLFHLPFDLLAAFLSSELTRNFVIRNDYGLREYTTYVYR
ncbi:MAG: class I SAM-dependent methyltransferase [Thermoanaerobaculia bacterium]|nr:class I SAM-dependent methyltransferase [Thermoanaerobaculia bacterium]